MKASSSLLLVLPLLMLAACGPTPAPEAPPVVVPPGIDPVTGQPVDLTPGLNDREPDTCHAADYQYLMGQSETAVTAAGITRPTRLVPMGGIVSQEEYNSFRINFHLDAAGTIVLINCG
jgi:hypothetical protein